MSDEEYEEVAAEEEEKDQGEGKSEAEKAMFAAKKKHEEDEAAKLEEYEKNRAIQREKEEEELRLLKEKQERRKQEREEEERLMAERREEEEARRREEDEERKAKMEEEKRKKDEKKKKVQAFAFQAGGGPNFQVGEKKEDDKFDKFGNIVKAKAEMGLTKDQVEEKKKAILADIETKLDVSGMDVAQLRDAVRNMHTRICRVEADKYDLEVRRDRQEYDLKELNERQRQISRNEALKKGLDPEQGSSRHPPKISVVSKYDRQIDRRNFKERRNIFEVVKNAIPHFPNCPPPEQEMEKVIKEDVGGEEKEEDDAEEEDDEEE